MKYLIVYAHPDPKSLNAQIRQTVTDHLLHVGHEVQVRDLYQLHFNPVLSWEDLEGQRKGEVTADVKTEQDFISWADGIIFIHPIWWTGLPAIMKGYIDRVFSYGFAYSYDNGVQKGLLKGKQAYIINSHGKSNEEYQASGLAQALSLTSDKGIYTYCGFEIRKHFFLDKADRLTADTIASWMKQITALWEK